MVDMEEHMLKCSVCGQIRAWSKNSKQSYLSWRLDFENHEITCMIERLDGDFRIDGFFPFGGNL